VLSGNRFRESAWDQGGQVGNRRSYTDSSGNRGQPAAQNLNADLLVTNSAKVPASVLREPVWGYLPAGASVFLLGPQWALRRAGSIQVHLRYRLPASLATPDEASCGNLGSRNLTHDGSGGSL
jgi:hypothetical protein